MNRGLYAIVDADALGDRPMISFARRVLAGGALAAMQVRAKTWGARDVAEIVGALVPLCAAARVPLYVNDRADVAVASGAHGVHVGMDDLGVGDVRRLAPGLKVGVSSHDPMEVGVALGTDADYIAFGPVFGTRSKRDAAPTVGIEALRAVVVRAKGRPVVAIGGITLENAPEVAATGAWAGAVIAALVVPDEEVTARARELHRALGGT